MDTLFLDEHRCHCGKLLLKGIVFDGALEIKCRRCGEIKKIGKIKLSSDDDKHYLLIINDQGVITNVSESACRILGYRSEELIGKYFTKINPTMPKEIGEKFFGSASVLSETSYCHLDTYHQTKAGENLSVSNLYKIYRPKDGSRYLLIVAKIKNDKIIERPKILEKINFLDNACDFYFDIDQNAIGEYISPSAEKIFGLSQELILGKNYFDFVLPENKEQTKRNFDYFSAREQPFRQVRDFWVDTNNKKITSDLYFTPKFDDYGKFTGYRVLGWLDDTG